MLGVAATAQPTYLVYTFSLPEPARTQLKCAVFVMAQAKVI